MSDHNGNSTALATRQAQALKESRAGVNVDLLKQTICRDATDDELKLFIQVCNRTGLDPFTKQIYFIKRWNKRTGQKEGSIQLGIDAFRLIAERSGKYAGSETHWCGADGKWTDIWTDTVNPPFAARTTVWKVGAERPFVAAARWASYAQKDEKGALTRFWSTMPDAQLAKCSEGLALRKAFPQELAGYAQAAPEIDTAGDRIINRQTGEIEDEDDAFERAAAEYAAQQKPAPAALEAEFTEKPPPQPTSAPSSPATAPNAPKAVVDAARELFRQAQAAGVAVEPPASKDEATLAAWSAKVRHRLDTGSTPAADADAEWGTGDQGPAPTAPEPADELDATLDAYAAAASAADQPGLALAVDPERADPLWIEYLDWHGKVLATGGKVAQLRSTCGERMITDEIAKLRRILTSKQPAR